MSLVCRPMQSDGKSQLKWQSVSWRKRYPDSLAAYCDDRSLSQCLAMTINDRGHQRNTSFRRYVGQAHQASVGEVMQIDQLSKVGIDCDQDSVFRCGQLQQSPIPGISAQRSGFQDVMPLTLKPSSQAASGAPVH